MITAAEALRQVLSRRFIPSIVEVDLDESPGMILAEDIYSDLDQPPFDRVAMDGIAIHSEKLKEGMSFKILGVVPAGPTVPELDSGMCCYEVMTGALLPLGADMVVRYEDLHIENSVAKIICEPGLLRRNIHPRGSDYLSGTKVALKGTKIRSTVVALLASVGYAKVKVHSLPKISILSTGNELVDIEKVPGPGEIRWSNGFTLRQELHSFGFRNVIVKKVKDEKEEISRAIKECLMSSDVLLLTGGVSAGKMDYVPELLKENKVSEVFHKVAQRPGKPLWFGETFGNKFVFGLPGNPVSCLVNLRKYVIPFLQYSVSGEVPRTPIAALTEDVKFNKDFNYFCPVRVEYKDGMILAVPLSGNGSGDFFQLRDSDGLIELKAGEGPFSAGYKGEIYLWGEGHA